MKRVSDDDIKKGKKCDLEGWMTWIFRANDSVDAMVLWMATALTLIYHCRMCWVHKLLRYGFFSELIMLKQTSHYVLDIRKLISI